NRHGAVRRQRPTREHFREISSLEVLHRDVEVATLGAAFVYGRNVLADATELLLKLRTPLLRFEDFVRLLIRSRMDELERDATTVPAVGREEDHRHAAASDLMV